MTYSLRTFSKSGDSPESRNFTESLRESLEKVVNGLGLVLLDLNVFRRKGSVQVRLTVYRGMEPVSINDCSRVHKAVMPRLELAFTGEEPYYADRKGGGNGSSRPAAPDLYLEVSSPGIDRLIKEGREFVHFTGQYFKCYRTDISDWTMGFLVSSDQEGIVLNTENGEIRLGYDLIAKARLLRSNL